MNGRLLLCRAGAILLCVSMVGCQYIRDRFKECRDTGVDLVNSPQTTGPIHIVGPNERATNDTILQSGFSRRTTQCLERGDGRKYRAIPVGSIEPIAIVNCVAGQASYEGTVLEVVWTVRGFSCPGW